MRWTTWLRQAWQMNQESRVFTLARDTSWAVLPVSQPCLSLFRIFQLCLYTLAFIHHSLPLSFLPSCALMDSIRMKGKHTSPVKFSSSQFSTWLCSLQEHISSRNKDHMETSTRHIASHPPIFCSKYVLMTSNSVCSTQRTEKINFYFIFLVKKGRMFLQLLEP